MPLTIAGLKSRANIVISRHSKKNVMYNNCMTMLNSILNGCLILDDSTGKSWNNRHLTKGGRE